MREKHPDDRLAGYWASAAAFASMTALWAFVVQGDSFYRSFPVLGVILPAATAFYLLAMPLLGYLVGSWRYQSSGGGGVANWAVKAIARAFNFIYSHLLIVLFTTAVATQHFLGWNVDQAVKTIDDNLFVIASRFAPWLAAYLAGFNLGRALGLTRWRRRQDQAGNSNAGPANARTGATFENDVAEKAEPPVFSHGRENLAADRTAGDAAHHPAAASREIGFRRDPVIGNPAAGSQARSPAFAAGLEETPAIGHMDSDQGSGFSKPAALYASPAAADDGSALAGAAHEAKSQFSAAHPAHHGSSFGGSRPSFDRLR